MSTSINRQEVRLKEVQVILKDLLKVIKVVSMYPENNPLPQSLKRTFAERLVTLTTEYAGLKLSVNKETLTLDDEAVFTDGSKEESLAAIFFEAGISCINLAEDLDVDQVYKFLDVIKAYLNQRSQSEDLVTRIWEKNLPSLSITTVEDVSLAEYDGDFHVQEVLRSSHPDERVLPIGTDEVEGYESIFEGEVRLDDTGRSGSESPAGPERTTGRHLRGVPQGRGAIFYAVGTGQDSAPSSDGSYEVESVTLRVAEAAEAMGIADVPATPAPARLAPNTALILNDEFKLSGEDEDEIKRILSQDAEFDMYESTIELIKEMLYQEPEQHEFFETVTICEKLHGDFIERGRLIEAAHLLEFYRMLEEEIHNEKPAWAERLKDARTTAGSRQRLKTLTDCANQKPDLGAAELRRYLDHFGWEALNAIADMLGDLEHQHHRMALCDYLAERGKENLDFVSKGIFDKRWFVVRNTIGILGRIGDDRALGYLARAVTHEERRVRLELSNVLRESRSDRALDILGKLVLDRDREVREVSINSIVARRGPKAYSAITEIINSERFVTLDRPEQQQLINAYSSLGGDHAIELLDKLITQLNPFNDPAKTFFRQAAFEALTLNRGERAEKLLVNLSSSWILDIKKQAQAALKKRRENIFGGAHVGSHSA